MEQSKFTEQQIAFALKQAGTGTPLSTVLRRIGISEQTFSRGKKLYEGLGTGEPRRLEQLEDGTCEVQQLAADARLDNHIRQDVLTNTF